MGWFNKPEVSMDQAKTQMLIAELAQNVKHLKEDYERLEQKYVTLRGYVYKRAGLDDQKEEKKPETGIFGLP